VVGVPVIVGAAVRVLYWVAVTPDWTPRSDADQYLLLARALAAGDGYSLDFPQLELHATAFRPPLYPLLLAVPQWVFGDGVLWPARLLSLGLGLGVIALTVVYTSRIAGRAAGCAAGIAVAVMPSLIANDTVTLTEPLALLLLLAVLITLDQRRPVLVGLFAGALILTRPNAYLVAVIAVTFLVVRVGWRRAGPALAACVLVVAPWIVRNQIQVGTTRLTTSDGFTLAAIYAPPAREAGGFVDPAFSDWYMGTEYKLLQFDEAKWNEALTRLALESIRDRPGYVPEVVGRNLLDYFEMQTERNEVAERLDGRNLDFRRATLPLFHAYLVAGLAGIAVRVRDRRTWPMLLIVSQFTVLSLLLVPPPRLRAPFDLMLCIGIGFLAGSLLSRRRGQPHPPGDPGTRRSPSGSGGCAATLAAAPAGPPAHPAVRRATTGTAAARSTRTGCGTGPAGPGAPRCGTHRSRSPARRGGRPWPAPAATR
jgi:4-amino-4-deoxy-L-arabinose transferase-like glycosyltransferase